MRETAALLANDLFQTPAAKTSHGLVRGPSRYRLLAVVDAACAGRDAGDVLDGQRRDIPIVASISALLESTCPDRCIVGVATPGGVLPGSLRRDLILAAEAGVDLVNGLHTLLADDAEIAAAARRGGASIFDVRRPRPVRELRHWHGGILGLTVPRVAVLGTDCCIGKRTTATLLTRHLRGSGIRTELISTGQTGYLQGNAHGFFFDATPNDFVSGELERVTLECAAQASPELIVFEGQSSFFNPSGPCGAEFILSGGAQHVILQHAPKREFHDDLEHLEARIPPLEKHVAMAELLGAKVIAIALNREGMSDQESTVERDRLRDALGLPVVVPLHDGVGELAEEVKTRVIPHQPQHVGNL